jgi:3D (Asp-Asp-Asp) domain-containing protein
MMIGNLTITLTKATIVGLSLWTLSCCTLPVHASEGLVSREEAIHVFGKSYRLDQCQTAEGSFLLTAYNLDKNSTGKSPGDVGYGITASGTTAASGRTVAVDPHLIPYGSLLYIEGLGWRVAEDTGGAIRGHHIDVLVKTRHTAMRFGVKKNRHVDVYVPLPPESSVQAVSTPYTGAKEPNTRLSFR